MLLRFYVRRAIPARGSSRSLEPLEFHISMRPTSPAADPSIPARVLRAARPSGTRVGVGAGGGRRPGLRGHGGALRGGERGADGGRGGGGGGARERISCAAGRSSRGPAPMRSRGWGTRGCDPRWSRARHGLPVVAEVMETSQLPRWSTTWTCSRWARATCRTSRCCARWAKVRRPVLLKRGLSATVEEWLLAAEYLLDGRQRAGHPLRARHPHLRDRHAQHAGPRGGGAGEAAHPPAGDGGSVARHRACAELVMPHVAGGGGGGRGRAAGRGPPAAGARRCATGRRRSRPSDFES